MTAWDTSGGKAEQAQSPSPSCFKFIFLHWLLSSLSLSWLYLFSRKCCPSPFEPYTYGRYSACAQ